jgi:AraC-like DNA-binding protein
MTYNKYYNNFELYSKLSPLQAFATLASFPLFYLYFSSLTKIRKLKFNEVLTHLYLPIIYGIVFFIIGFLILNKEERFVFYSKQIFYGNIDSNPLYVLYKVYIISKIIYVLQSVFYLIIIVKEYKKHSFEIRNIFSNNQGVDLKWVKYIGYAFLLVFIFNTIIHFVKLNYLSSNTLLISVSYIIFSIFFMMLGIFTVLQKQVYENKDLEFEESGILFDNSLNINKVKNVIETEKLFLNKDLTIFDLCYKLNTNRTYISNLINKEYGENFRTLINDFRLAEAKLIIKGKLENSESIKLEDISNDCGFNSYATFLRVFKLSNNKSPKDYIASIKIGKY